MNTDSISSFASWAVMALLAMGMTSTICLTLIVQWALTGRMGPRRWKDEAGQL